MRRTRKAYRSEDEDGWQDRPTISVIQDDDEPAETGLLDANGTPLYRVKDSIPVGFRGKQQ